MRGFGHHLRVAQMGYSREDYRTGRSSGSSTPGAILTPATRISAAGRQRQARRLQAGGFPLEMPVLSLGEEFLKPTTMLYRELAGDGYGGALRCLPGRWLPF